jgi:glycerate 2-kinase
MVRDALTTPPLSDALASARRILVVGGGKAGSAMAAGAETALADQLDRVIGILNIPEGVAAPTTAIVLHASRPAGVNHPTQQGVDGVERMFRIAQEAQPGDMALCLLSGGGSALLPAPVTGVPLVDKQAITRELHACGATIDEMNCVRKHLSRVKGGGLARAFAERGVPLFSLIVSDVIGDPLDVIASGPTASDPTTFRDARDVLRQYGLEARAPASVRAYLENGERGSVPETLKELPGSVVNRVLCNNAKSLHAAAGAAEKLGYHVINLGSFLEGETRQVALMHAALVRSVRADGVPASAPVCILSGGETTVTLNASPGKGGRNQEFVLAAVERLGTEGMRNVVIASGGTDGEDGPTDAAGAVADGGTLGRGHGLEARAFLERHDAYSYFDASGDLLRTGLTGTNVMDVRVVLIGNQEEKH